MHSLRIFALLLLSLIIFNGCGMGKVPPEILEGIEQCELDCSNDYDDCEEAADEADEEYRNFCYDFTGDVDYCNAMAAPILQEARDQCSAEYESCKEACQPLIA